MPPQHLDRAPVEVEVANIGGIDESTVSLSPGVTVLVGRNATNRTSFLRAIMAAVGSDDVNLKGDADEGFVELTIDDEPYRRSLSRRDGTVVFDGDPYLDDPELADLFAFLLESNDARRAVERGEELYDLIMRPVDTDEIDAEIARLEAKREELDRELAEFKELERQLPGLEEDRTQLRGELEAKRSDLESMAAALEEQEAGAEPSEIDEAFEELRETRRELESRKADLEDERRVVEALGEDRADLESRLDGLASVEDGAAEALEETISHHRSSVQAIESTIGELQSAIQFNEDMLDGSESDALDALRDGDGGGGGDSVTDQLVADGREVVCWTCGSQVETDQIERTVALLREAHREKVEERNELREEIDELEAERKHIERTREERQRVRRQLEETDAELEERRDRLAELEGEIDELETAVGELEGTVESLEPDDTDEQLALHREMNELEVEVDRLESDLSDLETQIEAVESRLAERPDLQARRDDIGTEIEELRSRIERLEAEAVEQFNDQMDEIVDLLQFDNLERVWIERIETEVKEGRRTVTAPTFDLHVVRTAASGMVYEDSVDHLSESEREVVGLVFALSGYLVHGVHEHVPFMLLDSLEAVDADRIATLIDHFSSQAPHLVVALLPEDAAAVDDAYERITAI